MPVTDADGVGAAERLSVGLGEDVGVGEADGGSVTLADGEAVAVGLAVVLGAGVCSGVLLPPTTSPIEVPVVPDRAPTG